MELISLVKIIRDNKHLSLVEQKELLKNVTLPWRKITFQIGYVLANGEVTFKHSPGRRYRVNKLGGGSFDCAVAFVVLQERSDWYIEKMFLEANPHCKVFRVDVLKPDYSFLHEKYPL